MKGIVFKYKNIAEGALCLKLKNEGGPHPSPLPQVSEPVSIPIAHFGQQLVLTSQPLCTRRSWPHWEPETRFFPWSLSSPEDKQKKHLSS